MRALVSLILAVVLLSGAGLTPAAAQAKPEGEMRWALYVTLAPAWFDPAEVVGVLTPFWVLTAMHDALVKPMPGNLLTPSLAESWKVSPDGRVYDFKLREGLKFHNGDPFTAEDVRFSFHRARGAKVLQEKVRDVEVAGPYRVRFHLHEPWPDFMTFYGTYATGAGWIVPKKYMEQVGPDGFKKNPVGLGPYKFVSNTPGVELVMEAYEGYWRKMPSVKRLVYKSVPEATTRMAMLKRGEVDLAYLLDAPQAQDIKKDPSLKLAFSGGIGTYYLDYLDQWDPKSPWHDRRVRLAASHALDRQALSDAETLGASRPNGSLIPRKFEFALPLDPHPYDPAKAKQFWPRRGTRTASMRVTSTHGRPICRWERRSAVIWARSASRYASGPWSAPPSTPRWSRRSSRGSASASTRCTGTRPRAWPRPSPATAPSPTAATRTSTRSTSSRAASWTPASGRRSSIRSSACSTSGCASPRSWTTTGRAGSAPGWPTPR